MDYRNKAVNCVKDTVLPVQRKLTPITADMNAYPAELRPWLTGTKLYDSSSSPQARVLFMDKDAGYFLKR